MRVYPTAVFLTAVLMAGCGGATVKRQTTLRWSPAPKVDDAAIASVARMTSGAPGGVAVGSVSEAGGTAAAVWTSGDSKHWTRPSSDQRVFPTPSAMRSVATGAGGFVGPRRGVPARRRALWGQAVGTAGNRGAVWTSGDGLHWGQQAENDPAFTGAAIASIQGGVRPGYVAVGTKDSHAAAWSSTDGRSWKLVTVPDAAPGSKMNNVAAAGPGVVAVGSDGHGAAVWASGDGVRWSRWSTAGRPFAPESELKSLQPIAPGFVAVGRDSGGAAAWRSADGHRWSEVVLGTNGAEADSLAAGGPGLVAVGGGPNGMQAWTSSDAARHWRAADSGLPAGRPGHLRGVWVLNPGLIAGGDAAGLPIWVTP